MSTMRLQCPECGTTIVADLKGGGRSNFGGAYCTGSDVGDDPLDIDGPHTAKKMQEVEDDE